jgi:hypothetical protein
MATLPKVLINRADYQIGGGVALRLRTQAAVTDISGRWGTGLILGVEYLRHAARRQYCSMKTSRTPE